MNVSEKAAYIKGLMEGLKVEEDKPEGKILKAMADLLEDLSLSVLDLEDENAALNEYIEEIDDDLADLEDEVYCEEDYYDDEDGLDDDDEAYPCVELECPACGEPVYIDEEDLDKIDELECPSCGKVLRLVEEEELEDKE